MAGGLILRPSRPQNPAEICSGNPTFGPEALLRNIGYIETGLRILPVGVALRSASHALRPKTLPVDRSARRWGATNALVLTSALDHARVAGGGRHFVDACALGESGAQGGGSAPDLQHDRYRIAKLGISPSAIVEPCRPDAAGEQQQPRPPDHFQEDDGKDSGKGDNAESSAKSVKHTSIGEAGRAVWCSIFRDSVGVVTEIAHDDEMRSPRRLVN